MMNSDRDTKCYRSPVSIIGHILIVLIIGLIFAGQVVAATIRVPLAYATIQEALDAAQKDDKVMVSQGTYHENITLKEGVTLVWNNENEYMGSTPGGNDFSKDPLFVSVDAERNGNYYLSQLASGQSSDSPCVDAGSAIRTKVGLRNTTSRTDKAADAGTVDIGYHYPKSPVP